MKRPIKISRKAMICSILFNFALIGVPFPVLPQTSGTGVKVEWLTKF